MDDATTNLDLKINYIKNYYEKILEQIIRNYEFPFDERYIKLLNNNMKEEKMIEILSSYTDQELDLLVETLENYIYNLTYDAVTRKENSIFNIENDKIILEKCLKEYNRRF